MAGFGLPLMYEICEENGLTYTFGFSTNPRLKKLTEGLMQRAVEEHAKSKQKQRLFECFQYQCDSWPIPRTVIAKAECHDGGTNQRFVVTNRTGVSSAEDGQREYDDYVQRGESEHRMDELKNGLHMDRLSCHRFMANFFRLIMHVAAMNLLGALRQSQQLPQVLQVGQPCTWRTHGDQSGGRHRADHTPGRGESRGQLALLADVRGGRGQIPLIHFTVRRCASPVPEPTTTRPHTMGVRGWCAERGEILLSLVDGRSLHTSHGIAAMAGE